MNRGERNGEQSKNGKAMNSEELRAAVLSEPFRQVRVVMSNGATYVISHPDGIMIRRGMAAVAVDDLIHTISTDHVNHVIPLAAM